MQTEVGSPKSVARSFGGLVLSSGSLLLTLALLGMLFLFVNFISSRRYLRRDCSRQQLTRLSDKTLQALKTLEEPVTVTVFYQPTHRLYELVSDLLKAYGRTSPKIRVEYVDPDQDIARAKQLAQQFQIESLNIVVFQSGSRHPFDSAQDGVPSQVAGRHKYLSDTELAEYDYEPMQLGGQPRVKAFKGEEAFTSAILGVTQAQTPLVWFTTGHGEKALDSPDPLGLAELKRYLEQQNMRLESVTLLERAAIPPETQLVVIAGPERRFTEQELLLLHSYLDAGGRLLALVDPMQETGLDSLLERWGIVLGMDIVVDPSQQLPFVSAANVFVTTYTHHPIVEKMKTLMTLFPLARSVRPAAERPQGVTVTPLALTTADGWGETNTGVTTFERNEGQDLPGPVPIAAAAERTTTPTVGRPAVRSRLVVIGDSEFVVNSQLGNVGNRDLLLGAVYWLAEQERLIGIGPKPIEALKLTLTQGQLIGVFWFSLLALPLACGLLGVGMWWVRRT